MVAMTDIEAVGVVEAAEALEAEASAVEVSVVEALAAVPPVEEDLPEAAEAAAVIRFPVIFHRNCPVVPVIYAL
jgi:hypothetical protein